MGVCSEHGVGEQGWKIMDFLADTITQDQCGQDFHRYESYENKTDFIWGRILRSRLRSM